MLGLCITTIRLPLMLGAYRAHTCQHDTRASASRGVVLVSHTSPAQTEAHLEGRDDVRAPSHIRLPEVCELRRPPAEADSLRNWTAQRTSHMTASSGTALEIELS